LFFSLFLFPSPHFSEPTETDLSCLASFIIPYSSLLGGGGAPGGPPTLLSPKTQQTKKADELRDFAQRPRNYKGKGGEADRHIGITKPRWLLAGKRKAGKVRSPLLITTTYRSLFPPEDELADALRFSFLPFSLSSDRLPIVSPSFCPLPRSRARLLQHLYFYVSIDLLRFFLSLCAFSPPLACFHPSHSGTFYFFSPSFFRSLFSP
jgi:hypothetical protein